MVCSDNNNPFIRLLYSIFFLDFINFWMNEWTDNVAPKMDRSCHVLWVRVMKFVCFVSPSVSKYIHTHIHTQDPTINGKMGNSILSAMNLDSKCINLANNFPFHCIYLSGQSPQVIFFWCDVIFFFWKKMKQTKKLEIQIPFWIIQLSALFCLKPRHRQCCEQCIYVNEWCLSHLFR